MDDRAGAGDDATDHDFTVAQDTEFDETEEPHGDEERELDDGLIDEPPGVDAERRVDLADDPAAAIADDEG